VLGHELNNSLAPIRSMASTLRALLERGPALEDWREDADRGLSVIGDRAESLTRFMLGYTALARLPAPNKRRVRLDELVGRVGALEQRHPVAVERGESLALVADPDQLEQALINLVKNGVEAVLAKGSGGVRLRAYRKGRVALIEVEDDGPGLAATENLFVPFFTTKPGGSGIGLALARQVVEAHGGSPQPRQPHSRPGLHRARDLAAVARAPRTCGKPDGACRAVALRAYTRWPRQGNEAHDALDQGWTDPCAPAQ
jgi:signal transduction histidine kinase